MPTVQAGYVYNAALHQRLFGQQVINTWAFRCEAVGTETDEASYLALIFGDGGLLNTLGSLRDMLLFTQTGEVTHEKWRANRVIPNLSQPYDFPIVTNPAGLLPGTCETANVAMCISRRGGEGGRNQAGRVAFAGQPAGFRAEGKWSTIAVNAGNFAAGKMVGRYDWGAAVGIVSLGFYVGPKKETLTRPAVAAHYVECFTGTARDTVRVQRSRTVGRGS